MEMQLQTNKIFIFVIFNIILLILLYSIPIANNPILENTCIYKHLLGKECWNCGMTRAFLSILHFNFEDAINYNYKCIVIFPLVILLYIQSWYKFVIKKN